MWQFLTRLVAGTRRDLSLTSLLSGWRAVFLALVLGAVSGLAAFGFIGRPDFGSDLLHFWFATRALLTGANPYHVPLGIELNPGQDPALYPLPTYLFFVPYAHLPLSAAGGVFIGMGTAAAAWGVARTGLERLPLFLSAPFLMSVSSGQWGPWLVAAALVPALGWVVIVKPNIGIAAWVARPSWRSAAVMSLILVGSVVAWPGWPRDWLANVTAREEKFVPLFRPAGFLLLSALVAWRRAEGRLLLVMSIVPQTLFFYDQLLLWLVPRTLRQSLVLSLFSVAAFLAWFARLSPGDYYVREAVPFAWSLYPAALAILLWNAWRDGRSTGNTGRPAPGP